MAGAALPEWGTVPGARGDAAEQMAAVWRQVRAPVVVPLLRLSVALCLAMLVLLFAEKVYLSVVILVVRLLGRRPERRYRWEPMRDDDDDLESGGGAAYPMVLVQIPMYNEREVS
jgi:beta-mannan synthase